MPQDSRPTRTANISVLQEVSSTSFWTPAGSFRKSLNPSSESCTPFSLSGPSLSITTRHRDLLCSSEKFAMRSSSNACTRLIKTKSSAQLRMSNPKMPMTSLPRLWMSVQSSRMRISSTKLRPITSGRSPRTPSLSDWILSLSDAKT